MNSFWLITFLGSTLNSEDKEKHGSDERAYAGHAYVKDSLCEIFGIVRLGHRFILFKRGDRFVRMGVFLD
ncbi:MAG: hypothetical protein P8M78_06870 [Myxococcota bacterium]|nr:hypothetical protein [Myxococcota bacterium]